MFQWVGAMCGVVSSGCKVVDGSCFGSACGGSRCIVLLGLQRVVVCI